MTVRVIALVPRKRQKEEGEHESEKRRSIGRPIAHLVSHFSENEKLEENRHQAGEPLRKTNLRRGKSTAQRRFGLCEDWEERVERDIAQREDKI